MQLNVTSTQRDPDTIRHLDDLHRLGTKLQSITPTERVLTMKVLQQMGSPDAAAILASHVRTEAAAYLTTVRSIRSFGETTVDVGSIVVPMSVGVCALIAVAGVRMIVESSAPTGLFISILSVATIVFGVRRWMQHAPVRRRVEIQRLGPRPPIPQTEPGSGQTDLEPVCTVFSEAASAGAVIVLDQVIQFMRHQDGHLRSRAAAAVEAMLPLTSAAEFAHLSGDAKRILTLRVTHSAIDGHSSSMRRAVLAALAVAGDESHLADIERWLRPGQALTEDEENSIQAFRARIKSDRLTRALLRPSTREEPELLLRPSSGSSIDSALLLRPEKTQSDKSDSSD